MKSSKAKKSKASTKSNASRKKKRKPTKRENDDEEIDGSIDKGSAGLERTAESTEKVMQSTSSGVARKEAWNMENESTRKNSRLKDSQSSGKDAEGDAAKQAEESGETNIKEKGSREESAGKDAADKSNPRVTSGGVNSEDDSTLGATSEFERQVRPERRGGSSCSTEDKEALQRAKRV